MIRPYNYIQDKSAIYQLLLETVKPKYGEQLYIIHAAGDTGVLIGLHSYSFAELFDKFTFADGSVCGIEEGGE